MYLYILFIIPTQWKFCLIILRFGPPLRAQYGGYYNNPLIIFFSQGALYRYDYLVLKE